MCLRDFLATVAIYLRDIREGYRRYSIGCTGMGRISTAAIWIPMIYSDGFNYAGDPSSASTFPIVPLANYLGQYGDNQMPDVCYLHHQLARGGTRSRWSDANIVAWERYDYRDVSGDAFNDPNATEGFFAANNKTPLPGDIRFDDRITRTADRHF